MGVNHSKTLISLTFGAGAVTITTGIFWYWLTAGSSKRKRFRQPNSKPIMGLSNVGATCFLNSVLQALASCNHFINWISHKDDANKVDLFPRLHYSYSRMQYPMIAVVYRAILVINREISMDDAYTDDDDYTERVPNDIIRTLKALGHKFRTSEEQDTFEFIQFLVGILFEEVQLSVRRAQRGSLEGLLEEEDTSDVSGEIISVSEIENMEMQMSPQAHASIGGGGASGDESFSHVYLSDAFDIPRHLSGYSSNNDISRGLLDPFQMATRIVSTRRVTVDTKYRAAPRTPFQGMVKSDLQCFMCGTKTSPRLETFDSLTLMLPEQGHGDGPYTVPSLIKEYIRSVTVHHVDCAGCSKRLGRPSKSSFLKNTCFARLPPTLCIHILRTSWTGGASAKRTEFVRFPERLNLFTTRRMTNQYISTDIDYESRDKDNSEVGLRRFKNLQYRLVAVISHYGDSDSGHFITYRRSPPKTQNDKSDAWFCISDESVTPVSLTVVLNTNAYMLFYEKEYLET